MQARFALEVFFEGVEGSAPMGGVEATGSQGALRIGDAVTLMHEPATSAHPHGFAVLEWEGGARSDMISDAVVATVLQVHSTLNNWDSLDSKETIPFTANSQILLSKAVLYQEPTSVKLVSTRLTKVPA